jgi:hypothetical protein
MLQSLPGTGASVSSDEQRDDPSLSDPSATTSAADGDGFDAIQRRITAMRREARERIEEVRFPAARDPLRRPLTLPSLDRSPPPAPPVVTPPASPLPASPPPAPPVVPAAEQVRSTDDWRRELLGRPPAGTGRADDRIAPSDRSATPVVQPDPPPAPAPLAPRTLDVDGRPLPPDPATVGRVVNIEEVPLLDVIERDLPARSAGGARSVTTSGLLGAARDGIERIAVTRSLAVLSWQLMSMLVLAAMFAWVAWFPFAASGADGRALVVSDSRMAPTIVRGDVVVVRASPDLPYPVSTVVAIEQGGVLLTERIVGEDLSGSDRILLTRSDGVSIGADRRVRTDEVVGSVRRIHRLVGFPVLWFTQPGAIVARLLVVLLMLSSAVGAVSLVVRWDLKRSDRALVSAIASGARTPR